MASSSNDQIRVLIADDDNQMSRRLADRLNHKGFAARTASSGKDAKAEIIRWKPKFVLADLMLPEGNALELIDFIKQEQSLRHQIINVVVMSGHNTVTNVQTALQRGAKDYVVKPFRPDDIVKRLVFHSRNYRDLSEVVNPDDHKFDEAGLMLHLTGLVLQQAVGASNLEDTLFNLTRMVNLKVDGVRCSVIQCLDQISGVVVTSNDDRGATGIHLDLYKYPEIVHVVNTGKLIAIENLNDSAELRHIRDRVKDIAFNSMIICPLSRRAERFGVLSLRCPPEKKNISNNEIRFVEIVAQVISLVLGAERHKVDDNFWLNKARTLLPFPDRK